MRDGLIAWALLLIVLGCEICWDARLSRRSRRLARALGDAQEVNRVLELLDGGGRSLGISRPIGGEGRPPYARRA